MALDIVNGVKEVHAVLSGGAADTKVQRVPGDHVDELMQAPHAAVGEMWKGRIGLQAGVMEALAALAALVMQDPRKMTPVDAAMVKMFHDHGLMLRHTMGQEGDPTSNPYAMAVVNLTPSYIQTADTNLPAIVDHLMRAVATLRALVDDMDGYIVTTRNEIQRLRKAANMKPKDAEQFDAIVAEIEKASDDALRFQMKRLAEVITGADMLGLTEGGEFNTLVLADKAPAKK